MPQSMTGFGAAEGAVSGGRLRLEVRSVNHRHLSVQLKLPGELAELEADLRERLRVHFARGHLTVSARWVEEPPQPVGIVVDGERARALVAALRQLARDLDLVGDVDIATVARLPDVVRAARAESVVDREAVLEIVDRAAAACRAMREREGTALVAEIARRLDALVVLAALVEERAPARVVAERERLAAAVRELAGGVAMNPDRLAQEVAVVADRLDITEELVRFETHVAAARAALDGAAAGGVGKHLGFLGQELLREANTMGSKAGDAAIVEAVIAMKGDLEKLREQVENLE